MNGNALLTYFNFSLDKINPIDKMWDFVCKLAGDVFDMGNSYW
jgi:hypothetical protein